MLACSVIVASVISLFWLRSYAYRDEVSYGKEVFGGKQNVVDVLHSEGGRLVWIRAFSNEPVRLGWNVVSGPRDRESSPTFVVRGWWYESPMRGNFQIIVPYLWITIVVLGLAAWMFWRAFRRPAVSSADPMPSTLP